MKTLTESEENYIKALFYLGQGEAVSNGDLSARIGTKGSSTTQAVKRLAGKSLVEVVPYKGVKLTVEGLKVATGILRKHRLWETFLVDTLGFGWEEVHPIAEQLEHVQSPELVERLAEFLGQPDRDPHGDPIPSKDGKMPPEQGELLRYFSPGARLRIVRVEDAGAEFFRQLSALGIGLGEEYSIVQLSGFDGSMELANSDHQTFWISASMSVNIYAEHL